MRHYREPRQEALLREATTVALYETPAGNREARFDALVRMSDAARQETRGASSPQEESAPFSGHFTARSEDAPQKRAFEKFIRYGTPSPELEARDLTTPTTGTGYQLIPQAFYPVLTEAKKAWGNVIENVNQRETADGAPMKIAFANDTGELAQVLGETNPVSEADPSLSTTLCNTDQCVTQLIKVSIPELQDSAFDVDKFIRDQFGKRYFRGLTSLMTNGSPSGNIESLYNGAGAFVTSLYSNGIGYEDLVAMYGALDPAYIETACWMMHSTTRAFLLGVKDGFGRPLYTPNPASGQIDRLLGLPVVLNQYMDRITPSTASPAFTNQPLLLGDFKQGYLLRTVKPGLAIARLNERYMDTLEVGFIGYFRAGAIATDAGTHPIIVLNQAVSGSMPSTD